jgi:hypothetical protein
MDCAAFEKDSGAELDYAIDWSKWLVSDTISSSEWSVPTGLQSNNSSFTDLGTVVWLEGGTVGELYKVTNTIVTVDGRRDERTLTIRIN